MVLNRPYHWAINVRQVFLMVGLLVAALLLAAALRPAPAVSSAGWDVLAASGEVEWRGPDVRIGGWQAVRTADSIPDGSELRTGNDGSAIVAKGLDRIELSPNTEMVVAARASSSGQMEIDQTSGSAVYTVEKRPSGTFSVNTPYVVAVVKGTKFSVDIDAVETSVSVTEGRVGVSDRRSGDSQDVTPGQTARASVQSAGLGVGPTPAASKANTEAAPKTGSNPNPSARANETASTRGNSENTPGRNKQAGKPSAPSGGSSSNGNGNAGSDQNDGGGSNAGGNGKSNAGGNGKGKGKGKGREE